MLSNFLVAIDSGHLEIRGRTDNGHWVLNRENLADTLDSTEHLRTQIRPYYLALRDPEPVSEIHPKWGRLRLFIYQDDSLPRPLWTWGMRKPLMKVREFRTTSISVPFAAVLIADGDEVNEKLRNIEPPRHNDWEPGRAAYGRALLEHLWDFVRRGLRARLAIAPGRTVRVKGLSRFLPAGGLATASHADGQVPRTGGESELESAWVHGVAQEGFARPVTTGKTRVAVMRAGVVAPEGASGIKGKDRGGTGKRNSDHPGMTAKAVPGTGHSRIYSEDISARAWRLHDGRYRISISALRQVDGELSLGALDEDGRLIDEYALHIAGASNAETGEVLPVEGASIAELNLAEGDKMVIDVDLGSTERFRLGVGQ